MQLGPALLALPILALGAIAAPTSAPAAAKGKTLQAGKLPSSWQQQGKSNPAGDISFTLHLNSPRRDALAQRMQQISMDRSSKWLEVEDLKQYITPSQADQQAVVAELAKSGIPQASVNFNVLQDVITVTTTVAKAGKFFNTTFYDYKYDNTPPRPRTTAATLPAAISGRVASVGALLSFPVLATPAHVIRPVNMVKGKAKAPTSKSSTTSKKTTSTSKASSKSSSKSSSKPTSSKASSKATSSTKKTPAPSASKAASAKVRSWLEASELQVLDSRQTSTYNYSQYCAPSNYGFDIDGKPYVFNFPLCLNSYYNLPTPRRSLRRRNDVGIVGWLGQNLSPKDLSTSLQYFRSDQSEASKYQVVLSNLFGATNDASNPGAEAALDSQVVVGMTWPLQTTYYNYPQALNSSNGDAFLAAALDFINMPASTRPRVVTMSYAFFDEQSVINSAAAMCNAMQVLTAMGTTFVVSSGDAGPYSYGQVSGFPSPGGTQRLVSYPSGCPYVLSVGATGDYGVNERPVHYEMPFYFNTNRTDGQQGWASGCGTSSLWPIPDFQKGLVEPYFANSANYNGSKISAFSTSTPGRTFPDLSVQGTNFPAVINGGLYLIGGTSMAAPVFASMLAMLNDMLSDAGQRTVGWMHPMLYSSTGRAAFRDVTRGGCWWKSATDGGFGYQSAAGFDAATGNGVPTWDRLRRLYGM